MSKKLDKLMDKAYSSYGKYQSSCDDVIMYLTPFFIDFPKEILEELVVDMQPSDGLIINDGNGSVFALQNVIEIIKEKGTINFSEFKELSI